MAIPKLQPHKLCLMMPPMRPDEYDELVASVKANGVIQPIVVWNGLILDGYHRYQAALAAGLESIPIEYAKFENEKEAANYVVQMNIARRHLSSSQRAMIAATHIEKVVPAASAGGVSPRLIVQARRVAEMCIDDVKTAVLSGSMSIADAYIASKLSPEDQKKAFRSWMKNGRSIRFSIIVKRMAGDRVDIPATSPSESRTYISATETEKTPEARLVDKESVSRALSEMPTDKMGQPVPDRLLAVFGASLDLMEAVSGIDTALAQMRKHGVKAECRKMLAQQIVNDLANAKRALLFGIPYCVCPICEGTGRQIEANLAKYPSVMPPKSAHSDEAVRADLAKCIGCRGHGWLTETEAKLVFGK